MLVDSVDSLLFSDECSCIAIALLFGDVLVGVAVMVYLNSLKSSFVHIIIFPTESRSPLFLFVSSMDL